VKIDYCKYKMNAWKCKEKWSPERNKIDPREGERRGKEGDYTDSSHSTSCNSSYPFISPLILQLPQKNVRSVGLGVRAQHLTYHAPGHVFISTELVGYLITYLFTQLILYNQTTPSHPFLMLI
jgi:hypothetical protein